MKVKIDDYFNNVIIEMARILENIDTSAAEIVDGFDRLHIRVCSRSIERSVTKKLTKSPLELFLE